MKTKNTTLLKKDEVHIWSVFLPDHEKDRDYFLSILSNDEYKRAYSFRMYRDQTQSIISRGILRCLLAKYLGEAPQDLEIIYGLWGKPCLPQEKLLRFNVSHSRDYILYAVTKNYEVGIDLEYVDKSLDIENMALSVFSPFELDLWNDLNSKEKIDYFFKWWVSKEAFLKAIGRGWAEDGKQKPLSSAYLLKQRMIDGLMNDKAVYPYFFSIVSNYASALFVNGPFLNIFYYHWNTCTTQCNIAA